MAAMANLSFTLVPMGKLVNCYILKPVAYMYIKLIFVRHDCHDCHDYMMVYKACLL